MAATATDLKPLNENELQQAREVFALGECWLLAIEIAQLDPQWKIAISDLEDHCFCLNGNLAVDAFGIRPLDELLADWAQISIHQQAQLGLIYDSTEQAEKMLTDWGTGDGGPAHHALARRYAAHLLQPGT